MLDSLIVEFDVASGTSRQLTIDNIDLDPSKIYWIHCDLNNYTLFESFKKKLALPNEFVELSKNPESFSQAIDQEESLIVTIQCLANSQNRDKVNLVNCYIYMTSTFCFTASYVEIEAVLEFQKRYSQFIKFAKTPCFILFLIFDNMVNDFAKAIFLYEDMVDHMDISIRGTHKNLYPKIMNLKKRVMKIKHHMIALREIIVRLSGRKITVISEQCRMSLYNLSNHAHMIVHELDSIREMLNNLLAQIENNLMARMNENMRVLTAFAAIFLPLSLIAGIYGMNFKYMPELNWRYGYFVALGLIFGIGFVLFVFFKKRKWLD